MRLLAFFLLFLTAAVPAYAQTAKHTSARLYSPVTAIDGATVEAAVEVKMEGDWKTYWRTPGDAGLAPAFDWNGSENFSSAEVFYPVPHRFTTFDIDNYGYKHAVTFPLEIELAEGGKPVSLKLKLDLLVCSDICVPETHDLTLDIPAGTPSASADAEAHAAALKALPLQAGGDFTFSSAALVVESDNSTHLLVEASAAVKPKGADIDLFVEHPSSITFGKPVVTFDAARNIVTFKSPAHSVAPLDSLQADIAASPLALTFADGGRGYEGSLSVAATPVIATSPEPAEAPGIDLKLVLFALLGGLILNLMPCVLPVLSLKILSVMSHGGSENKKTIFRNFMASAAGILASFWLMAGALSALKSAGSAIGWGIQFQHPAFLIFLIAVVTIFSLNMWGLFEIPLPRFIAKHASRGHDSEPTLMGHFLTGAFATLLATPCTAPFLGTAVGFALAGTVFDIFIVFTFLGLGLALPYIALALSPRLFKHMPKPGKWMVKLRRALSVALLLTAAWLINVLVTVTTQPTLDMGWQAFDEALIAPAVSDGRTVVVDITADWCLTCKANKRLVLDQQDVIEAISGENILRLQGDWTHRDEKIAEFLRKHGRYGIPFNIVYGPGAPEGIALPELLSKKAVMDALSIAAGE